MVVMLNTIGSQSVMAERKASRTTFAQALRDKYVDQEEFDNKLILPKDKMITTEITFVGFGKVTSIQKQLKQLTSIDLSAKNIELAGELCDLDGCLDRVQMLNLADNSLTWQEIISILSRIPNLKELIISRNHLSFDDDICDVPISPCRSLKSLTIGRVYLDWSIIIKIISRISSRVEQLDLWDNRLTSDNMKLNVEEGGLIRHLHVLKLSNNLFTDISWLTQIGPLNSLTELDLSRCQLRSIDIDAPIEEQLSNLTTLNISYNDIDTWRSISGLHKLKNLQNLICMENPVYISEKFAKFLTVGRLGTLKQLNREEITNAQRRDSEIFYLRRAFTEYELFKNGQACDFKELHPRYLDLVETYGIPEDLTKKQVIDKYIDVELCLGDKKMTKKLPSNMRVVNVKMLCKKLFNLKPSSILELTCCEANPSENNLIYILDKDGQTLHFFSVKSGHRLIIEEIE